MWRKAGILALAGLWLCGPRSGRAQDLLDGARLRVVNAALAREKLGITGGGGGGGSVGSVVFHRVTLPANGHVDGGTNALYVTNLTGNLSVTLTNFTDGAWCFLVVSNPAAYTVSFNLPALHWVQFQDGSSPTATTNGWTVYEFLRSGNQTNGWAWGRELPIVPGLRISFTTNANSITIAGDSQIAPMTVSALAGQAALSNIAYVAISSNAIFDASTSFANAPGGNTNFVVDFNIAYQHVDLTNDVRILHTTNRLSGKNVTVTRTFWAGETNRQIFANANWKWIGTTNNAEVAGLNLQTNRLMVLQFMQYGAGGTETNVVAWAAKQQF